MVLLVNFRPVLLARLRRFHKRLLNVRCDASTESVHEFRIACRELLACSPLLHSLGPTRFWQRRLRKAIKSLNRLRDLQQMQDCLLADQLSALAIENKIRRALCYWQRYQPELHSRDFSMALQDSVKRVGKAGDEKQALLLGVWLREWRITLGKVRKRLAVVDAGNLKTLHRLRIRYKYSRYLLELLLEAGFPLDVDLPTLKYWQKTLGEVEDYRVMAKLVRKLDGPEELYERFVHQANEKALGFMSQKDEFSNFLVAIDRDIANNYRWPELH